MEDLVAILLVSPVDDDDDDDGEFIVSHTDPIQKYYLLRICERRVKIEMINYSMLKWIMMMMIIRIMQVHVHGEDEAMA